MFKHILLSLFLTVIFISCDKDSGTEPGPTHDQALVGTWDLTTLKSDGNIINPNDEDGVAAKVQFNAGGTGTVWIEDYGNPTETNAFNWNTTGNQLTIVDVFIANYIISGNTCTISYLDGSEQVELIYSKQSEPIYDIALIGIWVLTTLKSDGNIINPNDEDGVAAKVQFNADGTGTVWIEDYGTPTETNAFNWNSTGNQVTIVGVFVASYTISGNTLTLSYTDGTEIVELVYTKQ